MIRLYHREIDGVWFAVALEKERIVSTTFSFSEGQALRRLLNNLPYNAPFKQEGEASPFSEQVLGALKKVYDGEDSSLSPNFAMEHLSPYTRRVLEHVGLIPTGYVTSYGALAKVVGGGPRAVGRALASNPFVLLVPCHRVVLSDMSLGGYGHGPYVKWRILRREDKGYEANVELPVGGRFLTLFPVRLVRGFKRKN